MTACEDLATKAELQELRNQINTLLGQTDDGQQIDVLQAGTMDGTTLFVGASLAATALQKIVVSGNVGNNIVQAIATGGAWFEGIKGNGTRTTLEGFTKIGKVIKANISKLGTVSSGIAANAGTIATVASLALGIGNSIINIGTLKLIEQNTKNSDAFINAYNRDYQSLMNFISKQENDIAQAQAVNQNNREAIEQQRDINYQQNDVIIDNDRNIAELQRTVSEANRRIERGNAAILQYRAEVNAIEEDVSEFKTNMEAQVTQLLDANVQLAEANETQNTTINNLQTAITALGAYVGELDRDFFFLAVEVQRWQNALEDLGFDLETASEWTDMRSTLLEAEAIVNSKRLTATRGGAGAAAVTTANITQNAVKKLASGVAGVPYTEIGANTDSSFDRNTQFETELDDLLTQIGAGATVQESDIQTIRDGVRLDMEDLIPVLLGATVLPSLDTLRSQTNQANLTRAAVAGVCQSTQPGGCMQQNIGQPLQNRMDSLINAGGTAFSAANNIILVQMQGVLNTVKNTTNIINGVTQATYSVVTNAKHGLQAIQNFASTAWEVTRADKIMNTVAMVMTVHNGMMLSNNLLSTVSEALNMGLNALNIRDENAEPIDIGNSVSNMIRNLVTSMIGEQNYAGLTARIAKANRIYQSSVNVLDAANDLFDSARSLSESTAENTGKIGNALREAGVVYEDAYEEFAEKINPQSRVQRNIEKFRGTLEGIGETVETVTQISSEIVDFQDNIDQLKESKQEWKEEVAAVAEEQKAEKDTAKIEVQVSTDINDNDFDSDTGET